MKPASPRTGTGPCGVDFTKLVQHEEVLARVRIHIIIRQLQRNLQIEKDRFQRLAGATWEGVVLHVQGRILDANVSVVRMFGCDPDPLIDGDLRALRRPRAGPAPRLKSKSSQKPSNAKAATPKWPRKPWTSPCGRFSGRLKSWGCKRLAPFLARDATSGAESLLFIIP